MIIFMLPQKSPGWHRAAHRDRRSTKRQANPYSLARPRPIDHLAIELQPSVIDLNDNSGLGHAFADPQGEERFCDAANDMNLSPGSGRDPANDVRHASKLWVSQMPIAPVLLGGTSCTTRNARSTPRFGN